MKNRLSSNGIVGIILFVLAAAGFIWSYSMNLRPLEVFIPRIALGLIAAGGILVLIKDLLEDPEKKDLPPRENLLPYIAGIVLAMWLYGWAFRNIGILTSTFIFLTLWWIWVSLRDEKAQVSNQPLAIKLGKLTGAALLITACIQLLFIELLGMHMPTTPLP